MAGGLYCNWSLIQGVAGFLNRASAALSKYIAPDMGDRAERDGLGRSVAGSGNCRSQHVGVGPPLPTHLRDHELSAD
jgi:hypothetical protein